MQSYSLSRLASPVLLQNTVTLMAQDRATTAALLAHLAEVDLRKLYRPAGYSSMFSWCVGELKLSDDSAAKRLQAARLARRHPMIFGMVEAGRLNLTTVGLLAPHLSPANATELVAAAVGKNKKEVEILLAQRFPRADMRSEVNALVDRHAAGQAETSTMAQTTTSAPCQEHAPAHVDAPKPLGRTAPLSPGRFALQVTITESTHEKLRYAQSLLGHAVPSGDLAQVLDRALDVLVAKLEQQKFGAGARTQPRRRRGVADARHIPAAVRRIVWERDGGRCTFVGDQGHRCEAASRLEFDHAEPFARGGLATPSMLRLRCQAHNQLDAERAYGAEFMRHQREQSRRRTAEARAKAENLERARARKAREDEVIPYLNALCVRGEEARKAASLTVEMTDATLEERVYRAVKLLGRGPAGASADAQRAA